MLHLSQIPLFVFAKASIMSYFIVVIKGYNCIKFYKTILSLIEWMFNPTLIT